jgi:progressive ankylosis protein
VADAPDDGPGAMTRAGAAPSAASAVVRSPSRIFLFWVPLAAQWVMMAAEGPFLAAIIARMGDPAFNLAAYGVAFAFAILVESPVIMLMSASTALVEDAASYRRMRNFAMALNAGVTALLLLVLVPAVADGLLVGLLGLPDPVPALVYGSLWILLPWPAAIGYRRFLHGVLIRSGRTRLVAYGTMLRLVAMAATALALFLYGGVPGAWVGAAALSAGVCVEALVTRLMAARSIRELLGDGDGRFEAAVQPADLGGTADRVPVTDASARRPPRGLRAMRGRMAAAGYGDIARFYYPLALTSLIGLTTQPMLTFFMGRSASPVESLAVFPVVHALSFLFRAPGFSYQEAVIALVGRRLEYVRPLARFGAAVGIATAGGLTLVAFTGLADFWFQVVSGLTPELAAFAIAPTRVLALLPAIAVLLAFQQALLVQSRTTRQITIATALEVSTIAVLFVVFGWYMGLVGVTAASVALVGGRSVAALYLWGRVRRLLADRTLPV